MKRVLLMIALISVSFVAMVLADSLTLSDPGVSMWLRFVSLSTACITIGLVAKQIFWENS